MVEAITRPVIAGNWKMNKGPSAARAFCERFGAEHEPRSDRTVLLFPPAITFVAVADALADRPDIRLGVQDVHWEGEGAFTGAISAPMASDAGAEFALVGHSERRHVFGETDRETGLKVAAVFDAGLLPVLCVGETIEQRRAGRVEDVILRQLEAALGDLADERLARMMVAYEPVWAIGTGETATPDDAAEAHGTLRAWLREHVHDHADAIPILYGGSVKPDNAAALLAASNVDGVLVGGASLDPVSFAKIADS
ncbi:MAG: triose-phosphate isomerase [Gemmatimonadota bacterium]|jgi:triosephosphate isomerase